MNQIISGFQAVLGARLGVPGPSEDHTGTSDSLSSATFHSPLWGSRKLTLPSSDQSVGELHVAAFWTADAATDGEGWTHLQILHVPEKDEPIKLLGLRTRPLPGTRAWEELLAVTH